MPTKITPSSLIGSGIVITLGLFVALIALFGLHYSVGWNATWRTLGVTPLEPHFFDMHVMIDYAACAAKGIDPYIPHACNPANFNVPPIWLWLSFLGLSNSYVPLLSVGMVAIALGGYSRSVSRAQSCRRSTRLGRYPVALRPDGF